MLRKQVAIHLAIPLAIIVLITAIGSWLLRNAFADLAIIDSANAQVIAASDDVSNRVAQVEQVLLDSDPPSFQRISPLLDALDASSTTLFSNAWGGQVAASNPDTTQSCPMLDHAATIRHAILAARNTDSPVEAHGHTDQALRAALALRLAAAEASTRAEHHTAIARANAISHVHHIAIWLGIAFSAASLIAVYALLRAARLVLKPVDALVKVIREIESDQFDARVPTDQPAEFAEIARSYNTLAAEAQAGRTRGLDTVRHLALTLNHELNNTIAIIALQVERLDRNNKDNPTLERALRDIQSTLDRMTRTVKSLLKVRRIVLTDYTPGEKMLDLQRSLEPDLSTEPQTDKGTKWTQQPKPKINQNRTQTSSRKTSNSS